MNTTLSASQYRRAAELAETIEKAQNELTALLSGQTVVVTAKTGPAKGRKMDEAARAKIAAGAKARWAKFHAAKATQTQAPAVPTASITPATSA